MKTEIAYHSLDLFMKLGKSDRILFARRGVQVESGEKGRAIPESNV